MSSTFTHLPVMAEEVFDHLVPALSESDNTFYDLTLGLGGHTEYFLERLPEISAVGIDRDQKALDIAKERLAAYNERFKALKMTYDQIDEAVSATGKRPNAILMDLGVSSMQLDDPERGFAYSQDIPLDMRMSQDIGLPASELIANWGVNELASLIKEYGEERYSLKIAENICAQADANKMQTTGDLADAIRSALPKEKRRTPYAMSAIKRVFQAIRIAVNNELGSLEEALPKAIESLEVGGRVAVMCYHSLEDRFVKNTFKKGTSAYISEQFPADLPVIPANAPEPYLKLITHGAQTPKDAEMTANPRAKSVRLRVAQKLSEVV